eukprot:m.53700 g.53700  ORF g.53700 m.53700 type:complete len:545 (+) comp21803_c0_seq3:98-1732(+)
MEAQMKMAADMMANMSPEQKASMMNMMGNMDPSVIANMSKNMGVPAPSVSDIKRMQEQTKNDPSLLDQAAKAAQNPDYMNQLRSQQANSTSYFVSGAATLKAKGNAFFKAKEFKQAIEQYSQAITNLEKVPDEATSERTTLLKACRLNLAACCLETSEPEKAFNACTDVITDFPNDVKARYRRGLAQEVLNKFNESVADLEVALAAAPQDAAVTDALQRVKGKGGVSAPLVDEPKIIDIDDTPESHSAPLEPKKEQKKAASVVQPSAPKPPDAATMQKLMKELTPSQLQKMQSLSMDLAPLLAKAGIAPGTQPTPQDLIKHPELAQKLHEYNRHMSADPDMVNKMQKFAAENGGMGMGMGTNNMAAGGGGSMESMAASLKNNPNQMKMAMDMMKNMSPEQTKSMMDMAAKMGPMMGGGDGNGGQPGQPDPAQMQKMADEMKKNPEMMKGMTDMMKNMDAETLMSMGSAVPGMNMSKEQAEQVTAQMKNITPETMEKLMTWGARAQVMWGYVQQVKTFLFGTRLKTATSVVVIAVVFAQLWGSFW